MLNGIFLFTGALVEYEGNGYVLVRTVDLDTILARNLADGETKLLPIPKLRSPSWPEGLAWRRLIEKNYHRSRKRYQAIQPLLFQAVPSRESVGRRAAEIGVHPSTLYRWIRKYRADPGDRGLMDLPRGGKEKSRLAPTTETIIQAVIDQTPQLPARSFVSRCVTEVECRCAAAGVEPPGANTVRRRIAYRRRLRGRVGTD
jgi:putative transposase